ncbi:MAG: DegT/DnrJ/EryC1/StrS family aminotransferase [Terracidiphilus sp.]
MNLTWIPLSDPDITSAELDAVRSVMESPQLSCGPVVEEFEAEFARYTGRRHAVAVASGGMGMLLTLKAYGIGNGDEVICSSYSWRETAQAIALTGARPVFADIDYWAGTLSPEKAEKQFTDKTRAIIAANSNGHPAPWSEFEALAAQREVLLIEDSSEAIGSTYKGRIVGSFGDCSIFDFSEPLAMSSGEGGMVVTDNAEIASMLRRLRGRRQEERSSVVIGMEAPYRASISDLTAALGLAQLRRIEKILERRKRVEASYFENVKSFEGIKDPYVAPDVTSIHWFLYLVHLGTRFARSSRDAIVDDLRVERIEAAAYCRPMHAQRLYVEMGYRRGDLFVTEKLADRAVALPFHGHLTDEQVAFVVGTMKDASINVGAGAAIY